MCVGQGGSGRAGETGKERPRLPQRASSSRRSTGQVDRFDGEVAEGASAADVPTMEVDEAENTALYLPDEDDEDAAGSNDEENTDPATALAGGSQLQTQTQPVATGGGEGACVAKATARQRGSMGRLCEISRRLHSILVCLGQGPRANKVYAGLS